MALAGRSSQSPGLVANSDGSVDLWFGPEASAGQERNWIPARIDAISRPVSFPRSPFSGTWRCTDRTCCFDNDFGRYSIGSTTDGLKLDADGGLTIANQKDRPADAANWLPAPEGRFDSGSGQRLSVARDRKGRRRRDVRSVCAHVPRADLVLRLLRRIAPPPPREGCPFASPRSDVRAHQSRRTSGRQAADNHAPLTRTCRITIGGSFQFAVPAAGRVARRREIRITR
jgi:hypothetical protein